MIFIDSSVWIGHLRNIETPAVTALRHIERTQDILVGDIVLLEVLQGARDDLHAGLIERHLRQFSVVSMLDPELAVEAAHNYRLLRSRGITVRKTMDIVIGTYCIRHGHALLQDDRDFQPMARHLGLYLLR
jgi:predicted nucleic acid-binding protein